MLREKVFPNQSSFRRVNQPELVKLRLLTHVGVHAQEAAQLQRRSVTNLSRPVVSHTDRVLMIQFLLEWAQRIIGALWGTIRICLCAHVTVKVWQRSSLAAGVANDTVACLPLA